MINKPNEKFDSQAAGAPGYDWYPRALAWAGQDVLRRKLKDADEITPTEWDAIGEFVIEAGRNYLDAVHTASRLFLPESKHAGDEALVRKADRELCSRTMICVDAAKEAWGNREETRAHGGPFASEPAEKWGQLAKNSEAKPFLVDLHKHQKQYTKQWPGMRKRILRQASRGPICHGNQIHIVHRIVHLDEGAPLPQEFFVTFEQIKTGGPAGEPPDAEAQKLLECFRAPKSLLDTVGCTQEALTKAYQRGHLSCSSRARHGRSASTAGCNGPADREHEGRRARVAHEKRK
jgi:hypothetical protein